MFSPGEMVNRWASLRCLTVELASPCPDLAESLRSLHALQQLTWTTRTLPDHPEDMLGDQGRLKGDMEWHAVLLESCALLPGLRTLRTYVDLITDERVDDYAFSRLAHHPSLETVHLAGHYVGSSSVVGALNVVATIRKLRSLRLALKVRTYAQAQLYARVIHSLPSLVYHGPTETIVTEMYSSEAWGSFDYHLPVGGSIWRVFCPLTPANTCRLGYLDVHVNSPNHSLMTDIVDACVYKLPLLTSLQLEMYECSILPRELAKLLAPLATKGSLPSSCEMRKIFLLFPENDRVWEESDRQLFKRLLDEIFEKPCPGCRIAAVFDDGISRQTELAVAGFRCGYDPDLFIHEAVVEPFSMHSSCAVNDFVCTLAI